MLTAFFSDNPFHPQPSPERGPIMTTIPVISETIGYSFTGAQKKAAFDGDLVFQIAAKYPQHKERRLARRRFVYFWEKDFNGKKWVRHGLCMTDDDGFLFDLKKFYSDHAANKDARTDTDPIAEWKIKKFDHKQHKWIERTWDFFGGIEDTIAFQKWIGMPYLCATTRENTEDAEYFENSVRFMHLDKHAQPVFKYHFTVPEEYLIRFRPGRERLFMFCPPDVISLSWFKQKHTVSKGGVSVAAAGGSNYDIDFEFIPEPRSSWLTHLYHPLENETMRTICKKYDETEKRFYTLNKKDLGGNSHLVKAGTPLKVPGGPGNNPFVTAVDDSYEFDPVDWSETIRKTNSLKTQEGGRKLHAVRMILTTNLEEHLSNLAFHTCLLDMEYQQVVESSKPFMEASAKVRQMGDLLELMYTYPGYKKRVPCPGPGMYSSDFSTGGGGLDNLRVSAGYNSVYYDNPVEASQLQKDDIYGTFQKYHQYADELSEAIWNDNNPVFAAEKDDIYREVEIVEAIVTSPAFYRRLDEWVGYELYGKENGDYPYFLRLSSNAIGTGPKLNQHYAPVVYRVIQDAFCLMLSMDIAQKPGKGKKDDTIAEGFYKRAVSPFESQLEIVYMQLDSMHNLSDAIIKKATGEGLLPAGVGLADLKEKYLLTPETAKTEATVLQIVFMDVVCKEVLKGADSYFQTVLTAAARTRSSAVLGAIDLNRAPQAAFAHVKVGAVALLYKGVDPKNIAARLEEGVAEYARAREATVKRVRAKKQLARTYQKDFAKPPQAISHIAAAVGAAFTLYD
ncbi:MAG: hypothetical protein GF363_04355, partial [Chitinivibrionales bacterium]|nr:hypothetical protein [Chitinivibrionales bacterium]